MATKKKLANKPADSASGKVMVRIDEKTVIYVAPNKVKGAKERFLERLNSVNPKANPGGRPGRPRKSDQSDD